MSERREVEQEIIHYLLGDVSEEECDRIGEKSVVDGEYAELLDLISMELMDDYVRGKLTAEEKASFDSHFPMTRERQAEMALLSALAARQAHVRESASASNATQTLKERRSPFWTWWFVFGPKLGFGAACVLIVLIASQGWMVLNWAPRRYAPPITTGTLVPKISVLTGRGGGAPTLLSVKRGARYQCLTLAVSEITQEYIIEVQKDGSAIFRQDKTIPATYEDTAVVVVLIPSSILDDGADYTIAWQSYTSGSEPEFKRFKIKRE